MEDTGDQEYDYRHVIESLIQAFGQVLSEDEIKTIVESCGGDLNESANAIMNITNDNQTQPTMKKAGNRNNHQLPPIRNVNHNRMRNVTNSQNVTEYTTNNSQKCKQSKISQGFASVRQTQKTYAGTSQSTMAGSKPIQKPAISTPLSFWTDQLREMLSHHNRGSRLLIIMRGAPGSGKSYLAKKIVEMTIGASFFDYKKHILSTDDYFMVRGIYQFEKTKLSEAHIWNRSRASAAMAQGLSPVIIDNTNIELWEMEPYVRDGVQNGYLIEVVEPNTPWAKKANQLSRKNIHGVPEKSIKRMLDHYENGVTSEYLRSYYRLSYPENMIPPILRNFPTVPLQIPIDTTVQQQRNCNTVSKSPRTECYTDSVKQENVSIQNQEMLCNASTSADSERFKENSSTNIDNSSTVKDEVVENSQPLKKEYQEIEKQLEEFAKFEEEWENGANWDNESQKTPDPTNVTDSKRNVNVSKPQRKAKDSEELKTSNDNLLLDCQDWTLFMPPWKTDVNETMATVSEPMAPIEKVTSSTCMEIGDTDIHNTTKPVKILTAIPRDINCDYMPLNKEKIPYKRMLDQSTTTNEQSMTENFKCKHEEHHFKVLRKLFKNVGQSDLRGIFDCCCGDVNWTIDIVLDGMANKELSIVDGQDLSDIEEDIPEQCECVAAYKALPNINLASSIIFKSEKILNNTIEKAQTPKRMKKEAVTSESSIQLKRQIEKNVVISNKHYSEHCLKIRKIRRGEAPGPDDLSEKLENIDNGQSPNNVFPSTSKDGNQNSPSTTNLIPSNTNNANDDCLDGENSDEDESCHDVAEKTVNIELGSHFVTKLDEYFGRSELIYPNNVIPKINIPLSLLNEINALWMESLMDQLEDHTKQTELMVKQDEEFARKLAAKEEELATAGKEPEMPDFKEIMDMDFALSLYQKDVAEWRNHAPNDLAAKLTRDKLYNLFPTISPDVLSELLMAHDNNFQTTVEVLLMSTGQTSVLETRNGVNKFVMKKEMERQEKLLEEQKKAMESEVEWPFLPKGEKVEMSLVTKYRQEADMHFAKRNLSYQKASEFIQRGMTPVAGYYSEVAAFHKLKFEQANSLAAASLIQVHAGKNPDSSTVDLHYLRVGEARESLDLFLDLHIQKLREQLQHRSNLNYQTLFFVTGRGVHSIGGPKLKPAVKKRLRERGLAFSERNPGLLTAKVSAEDKLSHQIA